MALVEAVGWGWCHRGASSSTIDHLDLRIDRGERVLLLGPSGSGKSTLLMAIAGLLDPHDGDESGRLSVAGAPARQRSGGVALVRQDPETSVLLSRVADEVVFGSENLGRTAQESRARADTALAAVGLRVAGDRSTAELSGGQKQRLAIATLLAMRPSLWLLDEPTAQLDPAGASEVREAVTAALRADDTLILVDHLSEGWWPLITRVIAIDDAGRLVCDCRPDQALAGYRDLLERLGAWLPEATASTAAQTPLSGPTLLTVDHLTVGYRDTVATFSHTVSRAEALVVRGPNGCGKTALALTLGGLLPPQSGRIAADESWAPIRRGRVLSEPMSWRSRELAARIASVFQQPELQFVRPTVGEEIALGASSLGIAGALLERFGLATARDRAPRTLSGGEKRRLSVATALASSAELIIADEPTFGQDRGTWMVLTEALAEAIGDGRSLVLPSHDELLAARLGARELWLDRDAVAR